MLGFRNRAIAHPESLAFSTNSIGSDLISKAECRYRQWCRDRIAPCNSIGSSPV